MHLFTLGWHSHGWRAGHRDDPARALGGRSGRGQRQLAGLGGAHWAPSSGGAASWRAAVRVLRAGVDRGLPGPGDITGPAAGPGRGAGGRARADRGRVLRHWPEQDAGVGAPPAGRRPGRRTGRPRAGLGRDCDRGVRAGVLREPVRLDGTAVRALRDPVVDAGGRRPGRLRRRRPRADDDGVGFAVQAGDHPHQDPGPHRDGRADEGTGPVPRRPSAVRVPARRRRPSSQQGPCGMGPAGAPAGARPADSAAGGVDLCAAASWAQHGPDRPRA